MVELLTHHDGNLRKELDHFLNTYGGGPLQLLIEANIVSWALDRNEDSKPIYPALQTEEGKHKMRAALREVYIGVMDGEVRVFRMRKEEEVEDCVIQYVMPVVTSKKTEPVCH